MHNLSFPKTKEVRDRWRIAIVGYREGLCRGESNNPCVNRGATALRDAYPEMTYFTPIHTLWGPLYWNS
jgi:hypothetical protein